jgi:nucleotide-binding universal stress UspA family protein
VFELGTDGPSLILVGVDGSPSSIPARAYAAGLARRQRGRLIAVHVRPLSGVFDLIPEAAEAWQRSRDDLINQLRSDVAETARHYRQPIEFQVRVGDPLKQLLTVAKELRADVVVVGGSKQAAHRLAGSFPIRLVPAGRMPVTVVP